MAPTVDTVLQDEELILRWLPGSTRRMVVVFTGMKSGFGGEPLDEFAGSASCRGENNVLFVTDRRATWFAAPGIWRRTVKMIKFLRKAESISEIVTLGNSMGGFGALLLPRDLRVTRAIAFAPQVTMDRALLNDIRWPDVQKRYGTLPVGNVGETFAETRTQYYALAGDNCPEDIAHLDLLPEHKRLHRFVLPQGRHNLARSLKDAGLLGDVVSSIIRGRKARVEALLAQYGKAVA